MDPVDVPLQFTLTCAEVSMGNGFIVIITDEDVEEQGPAPSGSLVLRVSVTVPAVISAALGVYTAFNVFRFGVKVPFPPVQFPKVAAPPMVPFNATVLPAQICLLLPALALTPGLTVTVTLNGVPVQLPATGVTLYVTVATLLVVLVRVWLIAAWLAWALAPVTLPAGEITGIPHE